MLQNPKLEAVRQLALLIGTAEMLDGEEGEWITVNGVHIFLRQGENPKQALERTIKARTGPKPSSIKSEKSKTSITYTEAKKKYDDALTKAKTNAFSFNPKDGKITDAFDQKEANDFYKQYSKNNSDVYVIGTTNHAGELSRESESAFTQVQNEGKDPLIGRWISDKTNFDYNDISFPVSGIDDEKAKGLLKQYGQESALVISNNGRARFLDA